MVLTWTDWPTGVLEKLRQGTVIPAHLLALDSGRRLDVRRQRALSRYYIDAGSGGLAVGVHSTQFAIREAGPYEDVLRLAVETAADWAKQPLFTRIQCAVESDRVDDLLPFAAGVADCNAAFFDVANNFRGCIAGCHEVLRRQGLFEGIWCLDPTEALSTGQADAIERVMLLYPELGDDAFVAANRERWLSLSINPQTKRSERFMTSDTMHRYALAILAHIALIAAWYAFVTLGHVPAFVMPSPLATVATLGGTNYAWVSNTLVTASEIFGGYFLSVLVGVVIAIAFSWSSTAEAAIMPLLVSLNMIPKVALGPLFIVWFSYGIFPNTIIAFSISFFPILLNTVRGFREVEPELLELVRSLRSSKWQTFTKIQLPSALPYIFSGMKVGAILAVAGAVVGEFLGSSRGLGYLMLQVQVTLDTAAMFMAVILITLIGVILYGMVIGLERLVVVRDARVQ